MRYENLLFAVFDGWKRTGQAKGTQLNQSGVYH